MARIRTIKPEFFTSDDIISLTPLARLFYVSLWCEADREGRLSWSPRTLKFRYFPGDDCSIDGLASELIELGLIVIYEVDGKQFAEIPEFTRHQVINNRETESVIPPRTGDAPFTRESGVLGEGKEGREGKGREGASDDAAGKPRKRAPSKTTIPENFELSDRVKKWANENRHDRLEKHLEHFRLTATAKGYTYADWDAALMNAITGNWAKLPAATAVSQPGGGRRPL